MQFYYVSVIGVLKITIISFIELNLFEKSFKNITIKDLKFYTMLIFRL